MTSLIRRIVAFTGIAMLASITVAQAQVVEPVEFTTTFPFIVGNATMPAGHYEIAPDEDNPAILLITGPHIGVFFEVRNVQVPKPPAKGEVVFAHYGQDYVLKNVWVENTTTGIETLAAEVEKHHIKLGAAVGETRVPATRKPKTPKGK